MQLQMPTISQMNANATHCGVLAAMIAKTTGAVIEFGAGHYSTPILHYMCKAMGRPATSVETNRQWMDYFKHFESEHHSFVCTNNRLISDHFVETVPEGAMWDVAFVDNGPETDRPKCVEILRNYAKFIVIHDSEPQAVAYNWGGIFDTFKHKFYWDFYGNGTTVVSDVEEIGL